MFEPEFRRPEAIRDIEGFSHLWLIWQFSQALTSEFHPTVRPPRLGGNRRVGVFASRAPYRPNGLGLSCVRLLGVERDTPDAPALLVGGADLLDGTPVFDIKPYIPLSDCRPDALLGYTARTRGHCLACWPAIRAPAMRTSRRKSTAWPSQGWTWAFRCRARCCAWCA